MSTDATHETGTVALSATSPLNPWASRYISNPGAEASSGQSCLFSPLTIRGVTFKNRIVVSPMCMYSAKHGHVTDFHVAHLSMLSMGGAALVIMEATGVTLEGRISPYCVTLHEDSQISELKRLVDIVHSNGALFGVQLAHAGRKASTPPPFEGRSATLRDVPDAWVPVAPSPIPFAPDWAVPRELTKEDILKLQSDFLDSVKRSEAAGVDVIEIHAAHGYLFHEFMSPLSNTRTDEYGGSFENRIRILVDTVERVRAVWSKPLFVRISADEYVEGGWTPDESVKLASILTGLGVDILDCSTGGNISTAPYKYAPGYQVVYAERTKKEGGIATMAVGGIADGKLAEEIIASGKADLVAVGRHFLKDPYFPIRAAQQLGLKTSFIPQYHWVLGREKFN